MSHAETQVRDSHRDGHGIDVVGGEAAAGTGAIVPASAGLPRPVRHPRPAAAAGGYFLGATRLSRWLALEDGHGRAFLFAPVCLGLGAILFFEWQALAAPYVMVAGLLLFAALACCLDKAAVLRRYALVGGALLCAGAALAAFETWRFSTIVLTGPVTTHLVGIVERREASGGDRWRYVVRLVSTAQPTLRRAPQRVSLLARSPHLPIAIGAAIGGRARLSPPSGPALPGLNDFAFSAFFDGIGAFGFFYGAPEQVSPAGDIGRAGPLTAVERWLYGLRGQIGDRIRAVIPGDAGAFAAAIVTDERRAISAETTDALRLSGLAHIIAISGLNMALAAGIFFVGVRAVLSLSVGLAHARPVKKIAAFGALLTACAYYLISGFAVSAERAFLMMAIMLVAVFFDRPSISLRNVALSALLILAISPSEVLGPSFQMSFAATLALVAGYALWKERPALAPPALPVPGLKAAVTVLRFFGGVLMTSLIGGLATAVFSIEHFHKLALYGLPANLAAMPVISFVVMPAGLLAMLLMPFGLDVLPLTVMGFGLDLVIAIARTVAGWGGEVGFTRLHPGFFPLAVIGILLLTLLRTPLRHAGLVSMAAACLLAVTSRAPPPPDLVIAEDGRLAAIPGVAGLASNRKRPPMFIFAQWQRALAAGGHVAPLVLSPQTAKQTEDVRKGRRRLTPDEQRQGRDAMRAALAVVQEGRFSCLETIWCLARLGHGARVIIVEDPAYAGLACDVADVVVTGSRLRFSDCRSGALLLSAETLRRTGALELRFAAGQPSAPRLTASLAAADRPWTAHRGYDWRSDTWSTGIPQRVAALISDNGE